jgi:inorganic pyrophosphatase
MNANRGDRVVDVVVEIPRGSRNKYEYDHDLGIIRLDRRLFSATVYPADYGFIPDTLGEDGDALDALVLLEEPTFPGCWVTARPVGVFWMRDDKGPDAKIVCVPGGDPRWEEVHEITDVPEMYRAEIEHFFEVYKMLEPGKYAETRGYDGVDAAWTEIEAARDRLNG